MSSETYGDSHPNVSDDSTEYETVAVTDEDIDRFLDGEVIDIGEYNWSYKSGSNVDIITFKSTVEEWKESEQKQSLKWPEKHFKLVYDPDNDDSDTMDFEVDDEPHGDNDMKSIDDADRTHVTMEVTMEIGDMDDTDKEVICELARQYEDSFREICEKNRDYSWSFLTTGAKLSQSEGTPFESAVRSQAYGLLTRCGDKRERLIENVYGDGSQQVSDDPATTAKEASNYYQFLALILGNPQLAKKASDA